MPKNNILQNRLNWDYLIKNSTKLKKIEQFVSHFSNENNLSVSEKKKLQNYLNDSLDRKKLQRVKDVNYDVKVGRIKAIPGLTYNKDKKKFTLRRVDKKKSTLKGLAPKRKKYKIDIKENETAKKLMEIRKKIGEEMQIFVEK